MLTVFRHVHIQEGDLQNHRWKMYTLAVALIMEIVSTSKATELRKKSYRQISMALFTYFKYDNTKSLKIEVKYSWINFPLDSSPDLRQKKDSVFNSVFLCYVHCSSPHLMEVRERIRINGKPLAKEKFAKYFFDCWDNLYNNGDVSY